MITGGSGFVGKGLARFFRGRYPLVTTYFEHPIVPAAESVQLDVRDAGAVMSVIGRVRPRALIHAAGNKNVRFCEEHPEAAREINALGTQNVARACEHFGVHLIYISTDLVFDCLRGNYREDEVPEPRLAYGRSKLLGENLSREALKYVAICRSSGIYGQESPLLGWFLSEVNAGRVVECFVDVFNSPTYVQNLAEMIEVIINRRLTGVFHTVGRERVSRFEFFKSYATSLGLESDLLAPVASAELEEALMLQRDSSLSSEQTAKQLQIDFNSVNEGFARLSADGGV
jgi:dTDP-4-dehydrorhamnose reductase